jgi:hypothetical protein
MAKGDKVQKDIIQMSKREIDRLGVIQEVLNKRIRQKEAARMLFLSTRQVRRIIRKVIIHGETAVVHGNRGKPSSRKAPEEFKEQVMETVRKKYYDFGPSFAAEKLEAVDKLPVSRETLRGWMIEGHIWIPRKLRQQRDIHCWRKRKECFGEMIQTDGSEHDWLEGRGPEMVLMGYIDDATGGVFSRFYPGETTGAAMKSFKEYIEEYGIPESLYFDRHSIYKTTRQANLEEQLKGQLPKTQFEMALEILSVEAIHAYSPQAKGRIERLFSTFQDRLIKELRLAGINNLDAANNFLKEYLPRYNCIFAIPAANPKNLHKPVPSDMDLDWVFALREKRIISKDFTVSWNNRAFLLSKPSGSLIKAQVIVLENLKGEIRIWLNNRYLEFIEITAGTLRQIRTKKQSAGKTAVKLPYKIWKPPADHPWRRKWSFLPDAAG